MLVYACIAIPLKGLICNKDYYKRAGNNLVDIQWNK